MPRYYKHETDGEIIWGYQYGGAMFAARRFEYDTRARPLPPYHLTDWDFKHHFDKVDHDDVPDYVQGLFRGMREDYQPRDTT